MKLERKNILFRDIKNINLIVLLLFSIGLFLLVGGTSYALLTNEKSAPIPTQININKAGKIKIKIPNQSTNNKMLTLKESKSNLKFNVANGYIMDDFSCTSGEAKYERDLNILTIKNATDGTTCTINYKKGTTLPKLIKSNNPVVTTGDGLYSSSNTNLAGFEGKPTYYFKGNITTNYVQLGQENGEDLLWRIVRINEDNSVRLILDKGINNNQTNKINSSKNSIDNTYYSNSNKAKTKLEEWYNSSINEYEDSKIEQGNFCEQIKVRYNANATVGAIDKNTIPVYTDYIADFKCGTDDNGKGPLSLKVGLLTVDEAMHAGYKFNGQGNNKNVYLHNSTNWWTMSSAGYNSSAYMWYINSNGYIYQANSTGNYALRPVINLSSSTEVTGEGTKENPYKLVVEYEPNMLGYKILGKDNSNVNETAPTETGVGLYKSTDTNNGAPTYYYRGEVTNNYIKFGHGQIYNTETSTNEEKDLLWRIVRVNEDGTIRLVLNDTIGKNSYGKGINNYTYMYYSESNIDIVDIWDRTVPGIKKALNTWYTSNLQPLEDYMVTGKYCEAAKITEIDSGNVLAGSATMVNLTTDQYTATFKCENDGNNKGILNEKIGLISVDEAIFSGSIFNGNHGSATIVPVNSKVNNSLRATYLAAEETPTSHTYLSNGMDWWIMGAGGINGSDDSDRRKPLIWAVNPTGDISGNTWNNNAKQTRPVINLKADTVVTGSGTIDDPYEIVLKLKDKILSGEIKDPETTIDTNPETIVPGLYKSTATNDGTPTYYYKGNVINNYVSFANNIWRIIRINEDGTMRLILNQALNNNSHSYKFNPKYDNYTYMYYSNSSSKSDSPGIMQTVDTWYNTNIGNNIKYDNKVATGTFCEQAKVGYWSDGKGHNLTNPNTYKPNFKCSNDNNGKGLLKAKAGLITADEAVHAGLPLDPVKYNTGTYLQINNCYWWTMSTAGFDTSPHIWYICHEGGVAYHYPEQDMGLRPVINLKSKITGTGTGTIDDPYVIQ